MAAPAFGSAGTQLQGSGSTMNVDVPDGVAAGDIVVVTAFIDTAGVTVTGQPTGFAHAPDSPHDNPSATSGRHSLAVMWKRATAADSTAGTYDFTLSASTYRNAQAIRYTGAVGSGDPWDVTNAADNGNTNSSVTPAVSDTTTVADTLLVWAATNWAGGSWTPPTSFTERRDTGDGVCTVADKSQASAGATGSITGTCTSSDKENVWLGALKPSTATSTGEVFPTSGTTASEAPWSDNDWTTPGNITADDAATANITATSFDSPDQSFVLKAQGFDFSGIPDGATINGVTARVNAWFRSGQGSGSLDLCQLLDVSGAKVGTNQCSTPVALTTTTSTVITKGGAADLWGNALDTAWVKDPDFGVALGVAATAANADVDIDYVTLEITYTAAAGPVEVAADTAVLALSGVDLTLAGTGVAAVTADAAALVLAGVDATLAGSGTASTDIDIVDASDGSPTDIVDASDGSPTNIYDGLDFTAVGVLTFTGVDPTLAGTGAASASVDPAVLTFTGVDVTAATGAGGTEATADPAVLTLTGVDPSLAGTGASSITVDVAVLVLSGVEVTVSASADITVDTATLTLTGVTPILSGAGTAAVIADTATLTLTGTDPTFAGSGAVSVTADPAVLVFQGVDVGAFSGQLVTPDSRTYVVPVDPRTLTVDADTRTYTIPADSRTLTVPSP